jgi:hypothetical protein
MIECQLFDLIIQKEINIKNQNEKMKKKVKAYFFNEFRRSSMPHNLSGLFSDDIHPSEDNHHRDENGSHWIDPPARGIESNCRRDNRGTVTEDIIEMIFSKGTEGIRFISFIHLQTVDPQSKLQQDAHSENEIKIHIHIQFRNMTSETVIHVHTRILNN